MRKGKKMLYKKKEAPQQNNAKEQQAQGKMHKTLTIIGIVLCCILVPILIVNCTLIVKSFVNKDDVPDFGGVIPMIVLTDSMLPDIKSGDLIICRTIDPEDVTEEQVISFFDPAGNGTSVVTHKVIRIEEKNGKRFFITKGTNNNTEDKLPVPEENLVGIYTGVRFGGVGSFALFMQTTPGLIVCVVVPIVLLVGYDLLRRKKYEKTNGNDIDALKAELEALKAEREKAKQAAPAEPVVKEKAPEPVAESAEASEASADAPESGGDTQ